MQRLFCVILTCVLIISMLAGCSGLQKFGLKDNDEVSPVSSIVLNETEAQQIANKAPIYLYFANEDGTKLKLEVRYIPMSEAKKSTNEIASLIVKELINGPKEPGLKPTVPEETKLRTNVKIDGDVATVDLSKEFRDKHPGGKAAEQLTIYSIVNSLTELKEISKVKFKIEGKTVKEFKGNFKFDNEFPRSTSLISKETTPSNKINNGSTDTADGKEKSGDKANSSNKESKSTSVDEAKDNQVDVFEEDEDVITSDSLEDGDVTTSDLLEDGQSEEDRATFYFEDEPIEEEILE